MAGASSHVFIRTPQLRVHPLQEMSLPTGLPLNGVFQPRETQSKSEARLTRAMSKTGCLRHFEMARKWRRPSLKAGQARRLPLEEKQVPRMRVEVFWVDDGDRFRRKVTFLESSGTALAKSFSVSVGNHPGTRNNQNVSIGDEPIECRTGGTSLLGFPEGQGGNAPERNQILCQR